MAADIAANIAEVTGRIRRAEAAAGREPGSVGLVAVSKTRSAAEVRQAAGRGLRDFGENYLQEALDKQAELADLDLTWHFIGPIQTNKTRAIAGHFSWVHSVDRDKVARRLAEQRPEALPPLQLCLQVNLDGEASKSGVTPQQLPALAAAVADLPRLQLRGLMAIPRPRDDHAGQRAAFRQLRELFEALRARHPGLDTLSMGMSADLEAAVWEGATLVRVGTDLFGPRPAA